VEADELFAIVQAAPLGRQEVRDHDRLAIAFGLWHRSTGRLGPCDLAAVVLVKRGLIMGDEDKSEWAIIGQWESVWAWEFASIVVPLMEALFKSFPPLNKCTSIVTRGLRVLRKQLFLRLLLTTCRASEYTLDLESCLGTLRQS
jgi:hypothetical protein